MPTFDDTQRQFTTAIRDPRQSTVCGIDEQRMDVYRELIFNNIMNFTQSAFPVACSIMSDDWWRQSVREFLIRHRSRSPYFNEIAAEFLAFVRESRDLTIESPDFLLELMHYEWVELALDNVSQDTIAIRRQLDDDLINNKPVLSEAAWLLSYEYPVHEISRTNQPSLNDKKDTLVLVYRKLNLEIGFRLLNPVFALLWQHLQQTNITSGQQAITQLAERLNTTADQNFRHHARQALYELYQSGAILGAHNERT